MTPAATERTLPPPRTLDLPGDRELALAGRTRIMGVVNVTPDSFSDGGLWLDPQRAVAHGLELLDQGADLLDLGAESTRPGGGVYGVGGGDVPADEELRRLLPVVEGLRAVTDAPLSIDTRKAAVARAALAAGGDLLNDVSLLRDPELADVAAEAGCPLILMHSRGEISCMQEEIRFDDLLADVRAEIGAAVERAVARGVRREQVLVDPGIGFGKSYLHNLEILAHPEFLDPLGLPVVIGASRKSFLGHLTGGSPPSDRLAASLAAAAWAAARGAAMVRVHDVRDTARFLTVWHAIAERSRQEPA